MLSFGSGGKNTAPIDYDAAAGDRHAAEHRSLPPPGAAAQTVQNWPNDPDVAGRASSRSPTPARSRRIAATALVDPGFRLPKQKVDALRGSRPSTSRSSASPATRRNSRSSSRRPRAAAPARSTPTAIRSATALTEPPAEYRIPIRPPPRNSRRPPSAGSASSRRRRMRRRRAPWAAAPTTSPIRTSARPAISGTGGQPPPRIEEPPEQGRRFALR